MTIQAVAQDARRGPAGAGRTMNRSPILFAVITLLLAAVPALAQETPMDRLLEASGLTRPGAAVAAPNTPASPGGPVGETPGIGGFPSLPTLPAPGSADPSQPFVPDLTSRENFSAAMQVLILLTVLSLAPSILIMMTSFTRIVIVLSLLRQALGTQQLPPNQILIGLSLFMTFLVMAPTWQRVNDEALRPYLDGSMSQRDALDRAQVPLRDFMIAQIRRAGNDEDVDLFQSFAGKPPAQEWSEVGTLTLIPAFMLSELKTAFLMGFKVYLPFLIIDMVVSSLLISMGMMMLPPVLISLPFKLLLFVLVDGWRLITGALMDSFLIA
jgi:flagellar biosynthetic protein FliP